jgi:hypothetical protein
MDDIWSLYFGDQVTPEDYAEQHKPDYCTQAAGNCPICSLSNYGRDCENKRIFKHLEKQLRGDLADIWATHPTERLDGAEIERVSNMLWRYLRSVNAY